MSKYTLLYLFLISTNGFINSNIVTKNNNNNNNNKKKNIKLYYKNDEVENLHHEFEDINHKKINIKQIKKTAVASGYIKYFKEIIQETFIHPKDCFLLIKILYGMYPRKQKKCILCNERPNNNSNNTYCDECKL